MNPAEYQQAVTRTMREDLSLSDCLLNYTIGLAGESGEVAELVKKYVFHDHKYNEDRLREELGDVLWYAVAICTVLNLRLEDVMQTNVDKLKARHPGGFGK